MDVAGTIAKSGHSILFKSPTYTADTVGGRVPTWATVGVATPAWVQDASADVKLDYSRRGLQVSHRIYVEAIPAVKEGWQVVYGTRTMIVVGVTNLAGLGLCYAVDAQE